MTGGDSRNFLHGDGVYHKIGTRNGRPCYQKSASDGGCIYWDGSAWKICHDGNGMTENGWNFSQQVDTPTPPTGAWSGSRAVSEMSRIYDDLRVEEISNGPGAFATAPPTAAAAAAGPIDFSGETFRHASGLTCDSSRMSSSPGRRPLVGERLKVVSYGDGDHIAASIPVGTVVTLVTDDNSACPFQVVSDAGETSWAKPMAFDLTKREPFNYFKVKTAPVSYTHLTLPTKA